MKKMIKPLSVFLVVIILCCAVSGYAASAAETGNHVLNVIVESNFFPCAKNTYYDISQLEDANGDIFLTFEFKLCAPEFTVINADVDELVWDADVLEWSTEYNKNGTGRSARLNLFPFAVERGYGSGIYNQTGAGRIVGNFSAVKPAVPAFGEDNAPVTLVKAVFKLIDKKAKTVVVRCDMDTLSYCDADEAEPEARYSAISGCVRGRGYAFGTYTTVISPQAQALVGDADGDGKVGVSDATKIQRYLSEYEDSAFDLSNSKILATLDTNYDGKVDVRDVTAIQRYAAEFFSML